MLLLNNEKLENDQTQVEVDSTTQNTVSFKERLTGFIGVNQESFTLTNLELKVNLPEPGQTEPMQADILGGQVLAPTLFNEHLEVIGGTFYFFEKKQGRNQQSMRYHIILRGFKSVNTRYEVHAEKQLAPRRFFPLRLFDIWPDTTLVSFRLWRMGSTDNVPVLTTLNTTTQTDNISVVPADTKELIGMGLVRIKVFSFLRQIGTLHGNEELSFFQRSKDMIKFLGLFSVGLWRVYGF